MKRFHVHVSVSDLDRSVGFYSTLFGTEPIVRKDDYAKWMLDDPRVNFAISKRGRQPGVNHLGIQVDDASELDVLRERWVKADHDVVDEAGATCCYARSDKHWATDPQGVAWETFHTLGSAPVYGNDEPALGEESSSAVCCVPPKPAADAGAPRPVPAPAKSGGCCGSTAT